MANILSIDQISKSHADKNLFEKISLGLNENEKVGLIGVNGCGKSTLLKLIADLDSPDEGRIAKSKELKVSYLPQLPDFNPEHTISEHIFLNPDPVMTLIQEYEEVCSVLSDLTLDPKEKEKSELQLNKLYEQIQDQDAFEYETKIHSLLKELGLENLQQKMKELSGGKLKKVAMAQALIRPFDLLLLDEPTNHLDINTIIWLQRYLEKMNAALLLITHDRYFLESIVDRIFEIGDSTIYKYEGNYSYFLEKKAEREEQLLAKQKKEKNHLRSELEWLSKQPKARGGKSKARIDKINKTVENRVTINTSEIEFSVSGRRLGKKILELKKISKAFPGHPLFEDFSYTFKHNERIGLIGANGAGKSTLLEIMTNRIPPDSGSVSCGLNTLFGYFDQNSRELDNEQRVLQYIKTEFGEWIESGNGTKLSASKMLEMFGFDSRLQSSSISRLSGGEKRRLQLVAVLMQGPNFLILDEPTNDLDLDTLQRLESFLDTFGGCLFIVSHDRYFMDRIVDRLLVITDDHEIKVHQGNFSSYLALQKEEKSKKKKEKQPIIESKNVAIKIKKVSFKDKNEFKNLEKSIEASEEKKTQLEAILIEPGQDHEKTSLVASQLQDLIEQLETDYKRWEELAEICS